jgi:hypothetical protein
MRKLTFSLGVLPEKPQLTLLVKNKISTDGLNPLFQQSKQEFNIQLKIMTESC